jgi:acetyltransferase-like isoleucine patch superfamily enzyme
MNYRVHPTATIEPNVIIGNGSSVWDHVHIRHSTRIGDECIVGGKTYIAYDVVIGHRCKINSAVYICTGVTIEDGVMIAAGTIFTNDRYPRAATPDLAGLLPSDPDEFTEKTLIKCGATIGAGCLIGSNLSIGRWAMVGMGSVVTGDIPDFHLCIGSPARSIGAVCRCGNVLEMFSNEMPSQATLTCSRCQRQYTRSNRQIVEVNS